MSPTDVASRSNLARLVGRLVAITILGLCVVRACAFIIYAWHTWRLPYGVWITEPKMIAYASWAQEGRALYPVGASFPYEVNWLGPIYFWLTGGIGRAIGASILELFLVGRTITIASGLVAAGLAGWRAARYGIRGTVVAATFAAGSGLMVGFGVMARPDVLADLLGFGGFLLATASSRRVGLTAGGACMALACLTKQTALWYLVAASIALAVETRSSRQIAVLWFSAACMLALVMLPIQLTVEPQLLSSLVGEASVGIEWKHFVGILTERAWPNGADVLFLTLIGIPVWWSGRFRDRPLAVLSVVGLAAALFGIAKVGADYNYFLGLRVVAALAAATLSQALVDARNSWRGVGVILVGLTTVALLVPSVALVIESAADASRSAAEVRSPEGRAQLERFADLCRRAADPSMPVFTDAEEIAVYQHGRAAFVDAFVFRVRVDSGQIVPTELERRILRRDFDLVVLREDVLRPDYGGLASDLPEPIAGALRQAYVPIGREAGYYLYGPREPLKAVDGK